MRLSRDSSRPIYPNSPGVASSSCGMANNNDDEQQEPNDNQDELQQLIDENDEQQQHDISLNSTTTRYLSHNLAFFIKLGN
jgi:hypothetical protein